VNVELAVSLTKCTTTLDKYFIFYCLIVVMSRPVELFVSKILCYSTMLNFCLNFLSKLEKKLIGLMCCVIAVSFLFSEFFINPEIYATA